MKTFLNLLMLIFSLSLIACDNDDDQAPIDQLPPATQTGAQTFGCLINGEAFVPPLFGSNSPRAFYQFVRGAYTFNISGSNNREGKLFSIGIAGIDVEPIEEKTYNLHEKRSGNHFGQYAIIDGGIEFIGTPSEQNPGKLYIDFLDEEKGIISGRFEFTVFDNDGNEFKITDGRFDMNYTN